MVPVSALLLLVMAAPAPGPKEGTDFPSRWDFWRRQVLTEVGRDVIVDGYKRLLTDYPGHPQAAEVMMDLAHLVECTYRPLKVEPDEQAALRWARKAAATALPGTPSWRKAQLFLVRRIQHDKALIKEARTILEEVARHGKDDSLLAAEVESEFLSLCLQEGNLPAAEKHGQRLIRWYDDPARIPSADSGLKKAEVDGFIVRAGDFLYHTYLWWPGLTEADRAARIHKLASRAVLSPRVQMEIFQQFAPRLDQPVLPAGW